MPRPKYVVLMVIDCLRSDHLGCYGYARDTSPTIDALVRSGTRFELCYPQAVYTFPSHVSMLTSIHHATHRLKNGNVLKYNFKTIADFMKDAGYATGGFVSNGMIGGDLGFREHFDVYDDGLSSDNGRSDKFSRSAPETTKALMSWLDRSTADNHFLFVHFNDCHGPYTVPEPYRSLFLNDQLYKGDKTLTIGKGEKEVIRPEYAVDGRQEADFYIAQYDAAIRYVDHHIDAVYKALSERAAPEDILLIITGDHGEGMGEHDIYFMHGKAFYEEFIKVPLLMIGGGVPAGRVIAEPARHIDILPTVLDLLNAGPIPDYLQGASLRPLLQGREGPRPGAEVFGIGRTSAYLRDGQWKYIKNKDYSMLPPKRGTAEVKRRLKGTFVRPQEELFNLRDDPAEKINLVVTEKAKAAELRRKLDQLIAQYAAVDLQSFTHTNAPIADEEQINQRLRALGYMD